MADEEEEFQEEEMWGGVVLKQKQRKQGFTTKNKKCLSSSSSASCLSSAWQLPSHKSQEKMVSKGKNVNLGQASSGPVKIPGWYKMQNSCQGSERVGKDVMNNGEEEEGEDGDEETMVPPHEYMAKKMARTRSASHSMCEGVGRTLKGRDLCKLRNAILIQTGFLEK
ncbi:Senescence regulator [Heracleum sosnowskyi]|uniref:Senescence regulator n=1 Tax=Heracleum sosnowskyi TaxID=360622 RepID=A0AAD8I043_9APIA|nr:Senescence regulator [Heracleum sosnowskyi]